MKIIQKIIIEKESVSDVNYEITELLIASAEKVSTGDVFLTFETSKADIDLEISCEGYLIHNLKLNDILMPGDIAAIVVDNIDESNIEIFKTKYLTAKKVQNIIKSDVSFSKKALVAIKTNNLSIDDFDSFSHVKEKDVLEMIDHRKISNFDLNSLGKPVNGDVILIGSKGGSKMVIDAIRSMENLFPKAILEDNPVGIKDVMGVPVIGNSLLLNQLLKLGYNNIVLCFGTIFNRQKRLEKYLELKEMGFNFPNIIHKDASVEPSVFIGSANIILAGAIVGSEAKIHDLNYINTGSILSHECVLKNNIHLSPGSTIGGRVSIGNNTLIGMNSTIYFDAKIGANVTVNNGVNVSADVPDNEIIK